MFGVAHLGVFLGRILLDTVVYVGAMERFNHSRTPVLGRFVESCGRGQRLEKSSLELCGGCNKIPSPGVPVTVHFGGLDGGSLYVLSHTHLRDPHPSRIHTTSILAQRSNPHSITASIRKSHSRPRHSFGVLSAYYLHITRLLPAYRVHIPGKIAPRERLFSTYYLLISHLLSAYYLIIAPRGANTRLDGPSGVGFDAIEISVFFYCTFWRYKLATMLTAPTP